MLTSFEHKEATNWSSVFLVGFFQFDIYVFIMDVFV